MDVQTVERWMEGYIRAWNSNDPGEIGDLFADDAAYYTGPFDEPWIGREVILQEWLNRKDEPGTFGFRYEVLAVSDHLGVVRGWTKYYKPDREYSNIWVIRFDGQGRCEEFTEWWVKRR
jgi:uncharacterized protein (TIGR02246 family)